MCHRGWHGTVAHGAQDAIHVNPRPHKRPDETTHSAIILRLPCCVEKQKIAAHAVRHAIILPDCHEGGDDGDQRSEEEDGLLLWFVCRVYEMEVKRKKRERK